MGVDREVTAGVVRVWVARWDTVDAGALSRALGWLSEEERAAAAAFRDPLLGGERAAGRALARWCLSRCAPVAPWEWRWVVDGFGRPSADPARSGGRDLRFSLSRASGLAVCAVRVGAPVGADVEREGPGASSWCASEAVAKGCGRGLSARVESVGGGRWIADGALWRTSAIALPPGWVGAVAVPGDAAPWVEMVDAVEAGFGTIAP